MEFSEKNVSFMMLTHPLSGGVIAVRADMVVMAEDMKEGGTIVSLSNGESFFCRESAEDIVGLMRG